MEPVFAELRKGFKKIRDRMPPHYHPHSLELLGGGSRIPYVKTLIKEIFGMEPSRTLNSNESVSRGAAIYGAVASKTILFDYNLPNYNLIDICISWNNTKLGNFFG